MDIIHCHSQEEVSYYLDKYNLRWASGNKGLTSSEFELQEGYYRNHPTNFLLCFHDKFVTYSNNITGYKNIIEGCLPDNQYYLYDLNDNLITITYIDCIDKYLPCVIYHNNRKFEINTENIEVIKNMLENE